MLDFAGGHFKAHKDTPKGENHIGTLLIGLPFAFTGGQLILEHGSDKATVDWSHAHEHLKGEARTPLALPWVFFYSDVQHEILPVQSGHRLTLAYDVFSSPGVTYQSTEALHNIVHVSDTTIYRDLKAFLDDAALFSTGSTLALSLMHEYPVVTVKTEAEVHQEMSHRTWLPTQHPETKQRVISLLKGESPHTSLLLSSPAQSGRIERRGLHLLSCCKGPWPTHRCQGSLQTRLFKLGRKQTSRRLQSLSSKRGSRHRRLLLRDLRRSLDRG